jgi:hypothetical protein
MKKYSKIISVHVAIGISVFYFLVHPFTAVLYWFEYTNTDYAFSLFLKVLEDQFLESFSFNMIQMSAFLTALGGFLGLLSGLLWVNFNKKQKLIKKQEHIIKRDVQKLIELGENDWVEFKSSMKYDYFKKMPNRDLELVIAKTIVGFMNAKGGKLIVGINDDGKFLGLENDYKTLKHPNKDGYERNVFKIISNFIGQEFCYKNHVAFYQFNEKDVCLIDIESSQNPAYLTDGKNTTFYARTGNATHPLSVKEAVKYLENRRN